MQMKNLKFLMWQKKIQGDRSIRKSGDLFARAERGLLLPQILIDIGFSVVDGKKNYQLISSLDPISEIFTLVSPLTITLSTLISEGHLAFDDVRSWSNKYSLFYLISYILATACLATRILSWAFVIFRSKDESWLRDKVFAFLHRWAALDRIVLSLSGLLLFLNFYSGLLIFLPAALLGATQALFLENYVKIRDQSFHSKIVITTGFVLMRIASLLLNALYIKLEVQAVLVLVALLGGLYVLWILYRGRRMHIHPLPLAGKVVYSATYISTVVVLLASILSSRQHSTQQVIFESVVSIAVLLFFCKGVFQLRLSLSSRQLDIDAITDLEYLIATEESLLDTNIYNSTQLLLMGLLKKHQTNQCQNPTCLVNSSSQYKYIDRNSLNLNSEMAGNSLRFKLYLKCLYESQIAVEPYSSALIVSYIGFLYNQFDNEYLVCQTYAKFQHLPFSFFERLNVAVILRLLREKRQLFNRQLFGGQLEIESVLNSEKQFETLLAQVQEYLRGQQDTWIYLQNEQIDCKELRKTLTCNFQLLEALDARWEPLKHHFAVNKSWHFFYLFCRAFLNNEELLRKELETMGSCLKEALATHEALLLDAEFGVDALIDRRVLFHSQSLYLHAAHDEKGHVIIVGLSKNVVELSGFSRAELLESSIEVLMTAETRLFHAQKLNTWLQNGSILIQEAYSIRETVFVHKTGLRVRSVKYFKMFISVKGDIEYVCLLKINEQNKMNSFQLLWHPQKLNNEMNQKLTSDWIQENSLKENSNFSKDGENDLINNESNIFLKLDSYTFKKEDQGRNAILGLLRIINGLVIVFLLVTNSQLKSSLTTTESYSQKYLTYMSVYRIPMVLGFNYYKSILGVGDQLKVQKQISTFTQSMKKLIKNSDIITTVFDPILNRDRWYPPFLPNEINQNITYNQIDLFYQITSAIVSLQSLPIDRKGRQFGMFNSYIKPAYDNLINATKYTFHQQFQVNLEYILETQLYIFVPFTIILVLLMPLVVYKIASYLNRAKVIFKTLSQINEVVEILKYYRKIQKTAEKMKSGQKHFEQSESVENQIPQQVNKKKRMELNLNRRNKILLFDSKTCATFNIWIVIGVLIIFTGALSYNILIQIETQELKTFEHDGFGFLRYFPTAPIVSLGCFEKLYSLTYPDELTFDPERYADAVASMNLFGQVKFDGIQPQSAFYKMRTSYSFGNPCTYSPDVLQRIGVSKEKCQALLDKVITSGLTAYMRAGSALAGDYMRGRQKLTVEELNNFSISVTVLSAFVLNAIDTWSNQFIERVEALRARMTVFAILLALGTMLLHLVFVEGVVDRLLRREYGFLEKVYRHMIPRGLLTKEKVLLQELINKGLLQYP